ncbi:methionyl-tRNA formyltransferase [Cylindrospermopsis raciborskii]|uniref:Methionyl-tRNA formyltransferase n=1 Tax=Cylindrospermopsis raciborskii CENA302 TaxID=1170768 RepID=A0A9Q5QYF4_9CYAN|nr:methionyl-tRNA formyltransferase [Cylindrospermopsis raciborskii]NLQ06452.1 methionyl-tRNA formyltransferase [Cylindrospermopsis raciborskii MVCC19]OHY32088.1 methionyl-tRNA formyltransferase [Cylindrospermopsis raciborskii MVCC14]OPH10711.1 methionyl-tRNA formyltransferase [Cylindrospermopsis raciborskii CENA302]
MKIVFFGTPNFAIPTLKKLLDDSKFEVLAVVTQPDKRRERGNQLTPSPVKTLAKAHNLIIWQPERIKKDSGTLTKLRELNADFFIVVAYGQILSTRILNMPKLGCINLHGSILPEYRGAAPIQWSIYKGERKTGVTTMLMDAGMDTGDMLLKASLPIGLLDNAQVIADQLAEIGGDLLIETLIKFKNGEVTPIPQNDSLATYASLINKEDYYLDWSRTARELHNQIRGFYPNCIATFRHQPLKILATVPLESAYIQELPKEIQSKLEKVADLSAQLAPPGSVLSIIRGLGAVIQTGEGCLWLREVQPTGKKLQSGWDFVNGTRLTVGETIR